ncbi:MAG: ABC transporter permease, partial [Kiritimatiellae bacterium]|nr:ABC transporter permease [Kiritimatiellia bacterium]
EYPDSLPTAGGGIRLCRVAGRASVYGITYEDVDRLQDLGSDLRGIVPARVLRQEGRKDDRTTDVRVVGTVENWFHVLPRRLLAGRVLSIEDEASRSAVAVLTENGARKLLATGHALGEQIRLGGHFFKVVGIVEGAPRGSGVPSPDDDTDVYIPLTVCRERFGEVVQRRRSGSREIEWVQVHQVLVQVRSTDRVEPAAQAIRAMFRRFHRKEDYSIYVPLTLLNQARETQRTFNIVLGSIAGISLLVGGIGIMNIMLASITERTREIGIRRAIGAQRWQIVVQFLTETIVLSGLGGFIGIGMGVCIPLIIRHATDIPAQVPFYSLPLSFGISVLIGVLFGLYPAVRAAQLDPIEALRHE